MGEKRGSRAPKWTVSLAMNTSEVSAPSLAASLDRPVRRKKSGVVRISSASTPSARRPERVRLVVRSAIWTLRASLTVASASGPWVLEKASQPAAITAPKTRSTIATAHLDSEPLGPIIRIRGAWGTPCIDGSSSSAGWGQDPAMKGAPGRVPPSQRGSLGRETYSSMVIVMTMAGW